MSFLAPTTICKVPSLQITYVLKLDDGGVIQGEIRTDGDHYCTGSPFVEVRLHNHISQQSVLASHVIFFN